MTTLAPCEAACWATAKPIPDDPPTTTTRCCCKSFLRCIEFSLSTLLTYSSGHVSLSWSHLTFHDRHYWMKRQKRSLDIAICLVSPRAKLNRDLGQELVTRAMDRMKVLGMGRLCFQFFAQPQNVVIDSPCTRIVLVSPHFIEQFVP